MSKLNALAVRLTRSRRKAALASETAAAPPPSAAVRAGAKPLLIVFAEAQGAGFVAGGTDAGNLDDAPPGVAGEGARVIDFIQRQ